MPVSPDFDPELYLRLLGERELREPTQNRRGMGPQRLVEAARALLVIGAAEREMAESVVDDYVLAGAIRQEDRGLEHLLMVRSHPPASTGEVVPLGPRRTVACRTALELPAGTVEVDYVSLGPRGVRIGAWLREPAAATGAGANRSRGSRVAGGFAAGGSRARRLHRGGAMMMRGPGGMPGGPPQFTLTDDRGTTTQAGFSGSWSDERWDGHFESSDPLSLDTAWLELDGIRLALSGEPTPCTITVEPTAPPDVAHRYLWQLAADPNHGPRMDAAERIAAARAAFVAAGHLPENDLVAETVAYAVSAPQQSGFPRPGPYGPGPTIAGMPPDGGSALPAAWRSILAGGRHSRRAPQGAIVLDAVTPPFDGFTIAVDQLNSDSDGFAITFEMTPGTAGRHPLNPGLDYSEVTWWARDDRGGYHRGALGSWGGGPDYASGTLSFWPALDPKAQRLALMPTALNERAVIEFDLDFTDGPR